jgi:hypothetical protein
LRLTGEIHDFNTLQSIAFHLPPSPAKELKVWLHQLTPENFSEILPARVSIHQGQGKQDYEVISSGGQVVLPLNSQAYRVEISLAKESVSDLLSNL